MSCRPSDEIWNYVFISQQYWTVPFMELKFCDKNQHSSKQTTDESKYGRKIFELQNFGICKFMKITNISPQIQLKMVKTNCFVISAQFWILSSAGSDFWHICRRHRHENIENIENIMKREHNDAEKFSMCGKTIFHGGNTMRNFFRKIADEFSFKFLFSNNIRYLMNFPCRRGCFSPFPCSCSMRNMKKWQMVAKISYSCWNKKISSCGTTSSNYHSFADA